MAYSLPPDSELCNALVCIPASMLPIVAHRLLDLSQRWIWSTSDDYHRGYNELARLYIDMANNCYQDLLTRLDRLYMLQAYAYLGQQHTLVSVDPPVYDPPIPDVPNLTADMPGLLARIAFGVKAFNNAYNGVPYTEFPNERSIRQQLEELITKAGETDADKEEILQAIAQVAALLA